jgi:hypothetical protein
MFGVSGQLPVSRLTGHVRVGCLSLAFGEVLWALDFRYGAGERDGDFVGVARICEHGHRFSVMYKRGESRYRTRGIGREP